MSFKKDSTAVLILEDGTIFHGQGFGAETKNIGELCFNTSMTGYQEIMTDPSYAGQIITFTFPHIGNTGTNAEDIETLNPAARGMVVREEITNPSSWRQDNHLDAWLKHHNLPGIAGIDTRALTKRIRDLGAPKAAIIYREDMKFDTDSVLQEIKEWNGLNGLDLAIEVTTKESYNWDEALWVLGQGYAKQDTPNKTIVAIDYGAKRNILRCLAATGAKVIVVPAQTSAEEILKHKPDGVFLSNGPGDPSATGQYAVTVIKELLEKEIPLFGICLGHQLLSLAVGATTQKMHLGHRGANHPVKDVHTGKVEITSQNHGFEVITDTLPETAELTHFSLFDKTNEGMRLKNKKAFSVQYHPEASPGPQDSHYLFDRFITMIDEAA